MKNKLLNLINSANDNMIINAVSRGLMLMIPLIMAGSIALVINNLPISLYQTLMLKVFGENWKNFGLYIYNGTFTILSIGTLISVSNSLAENYIHKTKDDINPFYCSLVSMACFFSIVQFNSDTLSTQWTGVLGIFISIIISILSSYIFLALMRLNVLRIKIYNDTSQTLSQSLKVLLPAIFTIFIFSIIHLFFNAIGIDNIQDSLHDFLYHMIDITTERELPRALLFIFLSHVFWFFGIHGNNIFEPIVNNYFVPNLVSNQELVAQGLEPAYIYTKQFFDVFVFLGGSGATLCLIIAIIIIMKRSNSRHIALYSAFTSIFNVNELMIYGLPVAFNLIFMIPFILVPIICVLTTSLAMYLKLVPLTVNTVDWTTPIILSGYKATGSIRGSILQIINLIIGVSCYMPFVYIFEKHKKAKDQKALKNLIQTVFSNHSKAVKTSITLHDDIGNLSRGLALSLKDDIFNHAENLSLEYQPQICALGYIYGAEALLRWNHRDFGYIPPPVVITLSEEYELADILGEYIIDMALKQFGEWQSENMDFIISINLSPYQIKKELPQTVNACIQKYSIQPDRIELEITEQIALSGEDVKTDLKNLKNLGIRLAMDDFGMGHSSLMYLKEFDIDTIKLDGALIKDIITSSTSRDIVTSIEHLAESSGIDIIAEFVETEKQRDILLNLNCNIYQGYLFSKSLKPEDFKKYYNEFKYH